MLRRGPRAPCVPFRRARSRQLSSTPIVVNTSHAAPRSAPSPSAGETIRAQAQLYLQKQITERSYRAEKDSAHHIQALMERLKIPSNRAIDLALLSVLRPSQARELFERFQQDDPSFSEAVISMVHGLAGSGEFQDGANLLQQYDSRLTRTEPNARHILFFWLSFNRVHESITELRRQEAAGRKDLLSRTYVLVAAANNNLTAETDALLEEAHTDDIPVPPWAYDRIMAMNWRFSRVQAGLDLVKEIQSRSPLHWQRPNGSLKYLADLLLRADCWTDENVSLLLRGSTTAHADLVYSVIQRFDYPAGRASQLLAQVRSFVEQSDAPPPPAYTPADITGSVTPPKAWEDLELS